MGHTHCDIDQLFSGVATFFKGEFTIRFGTMLIPASFPNMLYNTFSHLSAHSAYTWDELAESYRRSYMGINEVLVLKKLINWSATIDPYLNEAAKMDGMPSDIFLPCSVMSLFFSCLYVRVQALHGLQVLPLCPS